MSCGPAPTDTDRDSTDLCTSCGLCCAGPIFDNVPFPDEELPSLAELGLKPYEKSPEGWRFDLPCPRLEGTKCGIYQHRPSTCRAFRCKLLQGLDDGSHTLSSAKAIVEEAKRMIDRARPLMNGLPVTPRNWGALLRRWQVESPAGRATGSEGKLVLELAILNRFLDAHIRDPGQQVVKPKD